MNLHPFRALAARQELRASDLADSIFSLIMGAGISSASGVRVTQDTALTSVAVLACVEVRGESFSTLPGGVFRRSGTTREQLHDDPVANLLFRQANPVMTAGEFWRWKQTKQDLTGNAHARVVWKKGNPEALWPLYGQKPEVKIARGEVAYRYDGDEFTPAGTYLASEVLHWKGPILKTPTDGASLIDVARDTIGLSIGSEQFFARFLANGTHFPVYLSTDDKLQPEDIKALTKQLKDGGGIFGAGKIRIFDRGLKVANNSMSLKDADLTLQMRWYLEQVCRIFRVPLPLVQDWTHGTYTNSEQAGLWFAQHTITPIAVDTERVCNAKLFLPGQEDRYVKFNVDGLLRGDFASRTAGYQSLINAGVMTRNEARSFEDMNPIEGLDKPLVPLNMALVETDGTATVPQSAGSTGEELPLKTAPKPFVPVEPAPTDTTPQDAAAPTRGAPDMLRPVLEDAVARIRTRAIQDRDRGGDGARTREFGRMVLAPVIEAHRLAGADLDSTLVLEEALGLIEEATP